MTYKEYMDRTSPLMERYKNAKVNHCPRTAKARLREISKLYAQYRGISYDDAIMRMEEMLK